MFITLYFVVFTLVFPDVDSDSECYSAGLLRYEKYHTDIKTVPTTRSNVRVEQAPI